MANGLKQIAIMPIDENLEDEDLVDGECQTATLCCRRRSQSHI